MLNVPLNPNHSINQSISQSLIDLIWFWPERMTTSLTSLASSRPAVDEPARRSSREVNVDDIDNDDWETSSGRRSRMTTTTSVDDNDDGLDTCTVELEMDPRHCTQHHGAHRFHRRRRILLFTFFHHNDSVENIVLFSVAITQ